MDTGPAMIATKSTYRALRAMLAVSACMLLVACGATYRLERAGPVAGLDCERCLTVDRFGRQITFYLGSSGIRVGNAAPSA
jgi:hypothetical protein